MYTKDEIESLARDTFGPSCMVRFDDGAPTLEERKELDYQRYKVKDSLASSPYDQRLKSRLLEIERKMWRANVCISNGWEIIIAPSRDDAARRLIAIRVVREIVDGE